jgi:hypothetical protein
MTMSQSYRNEFNKIEKLVPRTRGREFEKLFNKICEDEGILISSAFKTSDMSQEIDGAVRIYSRVFLLEVKWESDATLAASKLYSFLGKINSKMKGTLGIFVSYNTLNDNFVNAVRNGIRQNCILIHGKKNIEDIVDGKVNIKDFLSYGFVMASTKNRVDINTSEFIVWKGKSKLITEPKDNWLEIYKGLTGDMRFEDFAAGLESWYSDKLNLSRSILNIYDTLDHNTLLQQKMERLIGKLVEEEKDQFTSMVVEKFQGKGWQKFAKQYFCIKLKNLDLDISEDDRKSITKNLLPKLGNDWEVENQVSYVIDIYYDKVSESEKKDLLVGYLDIYCDTSREDRFKQKEFANKLFQGKNYFNLIKDRFKEMIKEKKESEYMYKDDESIKDKIYSLLRYSYSRVFRETQKDIEGFINEEYDSV